MSFGDRAVSRDPMVGSTEVCGSKLEVRMVITPISEYIETRNGGYYVAGSRIGLDVVAHAFRRGQTAEDIFRSFPSIGSLAKV